MTHLFNIINKFIDKQNKFKTFLIIDFITIFCILFSILFFDISIAFIHIAIFMWIFNFDKKITNYILNFYLTKKYRLNNKKRIDIFNIEDKQVLELFLEMINFNDINEKEIEFLEFIKNEDNIKIIYKKIPEIEIIKSILYPKSQNYLINNIVDHYFKDEKELFSLHLEKIEIINKFNFYSENIKKENNELYHILEPRYISFMRKNNIPVKLEEKSLIFSI